MSVGFISLPSGFLLGAVRSHAAHSIDARVAGPFRRGVDAISLPHHGGRADEAVAAEEAAIPSGPISIETSGPATILLSADVEWPGAETEGRDWMAGAPRVSRYRRELAEAIREQANSGADVYLGPTDAHVAADALDGFGDLDDE